MKIKLENPFEAVRFTGGATFEPEIGWWSQVDNTSTTYGTAFEGMRDAIYIPTLQKNGRPVDQSTTETLKQQAADLGLTTLTQAAGMWVLSDTQEVQTETIWIAYATQADDPEQLGKLAEKIKLLANQDAVAFEKAGVLNFC